MNANTKLEKFMQFEFCKFANENPIGQLQNAFIYTHGLRVKYAKA